MPEASQYVLDHREMLELLIKHVGVGEGRWMLMANFAISPGNFGPSPDQAVPGVAVALQKIGIQRAESKTAVELTLDASAVNPPPKARKVPASKRPKKTS